MKIIWLRLEPEDVLLFRDGRPFNAGQDFRAEGSFPPQPAPVVGAIRAALISPKLVEKGLTFADLDTSSEAAAIRADFGD